jgi:hypothetical protein
MKKEMLDEDCCAPIGANHGSDPKILQREIRHEMAEAIGER